MSRTIVRLFLNNSTACRPWIEFNCSHFPPIRTRRKIRRVIRCSSDGRLFDTAADLQFVLRNAERLDRGEICTMSSIPTSRRDLLFYKIYSRNVLKDKWNLLQNMISRCCSAVRTMSHLPGLPLYDHVTNTIHLAGDFGGTNSWTTAGTPDL